MTLEEHRGGVLFVSIRNKATGWFVCHVTGEMRLQDGGN